MDDRKQGRHYGLAPGLDNHQSGGGGGGWDLIFEKNFFYRFNSCKKSLNK